MFVKMVPRACLCSVLILAACRPGPSSSGPDKASDLERKAEFLGSLAVRRDEAARAWNAIVAALPDRLWPTEVVYDGGEVRIAGQALSNDLLADFVSRLEESPYLTEVDLRSSVQRKGRAGDHYGFAVAARASGVGKTPPTGALSSRPQTADGLRELQGLASESGVRLTKCVFGQAAVGEFAGELPVTVEVAGGRAEIGRYLDGLARLPHFWFVKKLAVRAASPQDPGSSLKATVSALAYYPD